MTAHLPLGDIRVIDLTVARAGPTCVRQLADWGADVIRVEPPAVRAAPGPDAGSRHGCDFQHLHRNKRSLSLDLKAPGAHEVLMRLVDTADVLIENMRPPVKHRLGFDFGTVHARNPRLVYGSISGFGQDGPYAGRGGVDQIAQGMGGLMSVTGLPGTGPVRAGIPVSDLAAGLYLAIGVLVALHDRGRTGTGRWVQTSLLESMIAMMDFQAARWTIDKEVPAQAGNHHPVSVPMGCFASADGYVNIAGAGGRLLPSLCEAIGLPGIPDDPRFDTAAKRSANRAELNDLIAKRLRTRTTAAWVETLNQAGVPCGPVYRMDEVFADPQVGHLAMTGSVEHPALGRLDILRNAVRMTGAPATVRAPSPGLGAHSAEVLAELGYPPAEIDRLRAQAVI
ncbi:MAG TPA: CaiB/BaiF CoA-transferase family protein [Streptosporangiaceae bacterium]|nr:CaiB/BaiF CoA-transferase family protein [Streptosporangiaceae bacterium]